MNIISSFRSKTIANCKKDKNICTYIFWSKTLIHKKCVFFCISLFNCLSFPFQFWYSILTEETNFLLFFFHFWYCRFVFVFNIYLQFLNLNDIALTNFAYSIFCLPLIGLPYTFSSIGAHPWPCSIRILLFFRGKSRNFSRSEI